MSLDEPADSGNHAGPIALPSPAQGVSVWMGQLARSGSEIEAFAATLSDSEHARAARFGRPGLRDRYVAGRAMLRILLGQRLGRAPAEVDIRRGVRGRPYAADAGALDFNVSHTDNVAMFAFTESARIGVDIEHRERALNVEGIARKFMAPDEQAELAALAAEARRPALLRLWTCKEAMSKATGDALSAPFGRIAIATAGGLRVAQGPPPYTPATWQLAPIAVPGGYLATVALWHGA
ncbi:MAG: 4'-phosphopantetheinyl transferase superfamily protein [Casimicrobiaceae bacterium]